MKYSQDSESCGGAATCDVCEVLNISWCDEILYATKGDTEVLEWERCKPNLEGHHLEFIAVV